MQFPNTSPQSTQSATYAVSAKSIFAFCAIGLVCILLSVAAGIRSFGIGRDFLEYLQFYGTINPYEISNYSRFEIGFEVISWVFRIILNLQYEYLVIFLTLLTLSVKFYLFKSNLHSYWLAIISYIMLFYPIHEYTQIRASVAIAFSYIGLHLALDRKIFLPCVFFILGISFHSSIILMAVLSITILVIPKNYYIYIGISISIIIILFGNFISDILKIYFASLNPLISLYLDNSDFSIEANLFSGTNILLMLSLIYCLFSGIYNKSRYHLTFFVISFISFIWLAVFQEAPVVALRTAYILFVSFIFLAFKEKLSYQTAPLQILVLLAAGWGFYRSVQEGIIIL